jgi:uncharacterized membrane protein YgdD (TMEM256/DUF423 family)
MNERTALAMGCVAMFAAVAAGAFGAHALRATLAPAMLATWHTAVEYQAWHALALLVAGALMAREAPAATRTAMRAAAWLFAIGIALFSGSLYVLALTGSRWLGMLAPVGGVAFLAGWIALAWAVTRDRSAGSE